MRYSGLGLVLVFLSSAGEAFADAVPPPPDNCPPGTVGVTSHGGPACEKEAPKNCPNGWMGVTGGTCMLHQCSDDSACAADGKVCRDASLCFEPRTRTTTCGPVSTPRGPEMATPRSPVLGGPCAVLDEPVTDWIPVNVCGGTEACASPSECRPSKLCVTPNEPPPVAQPRTPSGDVQAKPGGCGSGCVATRTAGISGALLAIGALALLSLRRRKRP
jgi:hypothetical protein